MSITPKAHRLLQNPKAGGIRELFLPENDFKTYSTVKFPKKHLDFGGLETNRRHEIRNWIFFHMPFYIWTQHSAQHSEHLIGTSSNCNRFWGQNFKKSAEKAIRNLIFQFSELYISLSANPRIFLFPRSSNLLDIIFLGLTLIL